MRGRPASEAVLWSTVIGVLLGATTWASVIANTSVPFTLATASLGTALVAATLGLTWAIWLLGYGSLPTRRTLHRAAAAALASATALLVCGGVWSAGTVASGPWSEAAIAAHFILSVAIASCVGLSLGRPWRRDYQGLLLGAGLVLAVSLAATAFMGAATPHLAAALVRESLLIAWVWLPTREGVASHPLETDFHRHRLQPPAGQPATAARLAAVLAGAGIIVALSLLVSMAWSPTAALVPLAWVPAGALGLLPGLYADLRRQGRTQHAAELARHLIPPGILRFVTRYYPARRYGGSVFSYRAAIFGLDYALPAGIHAQLPETLNQIRIEELHRFLDEILGRLALATQRQGHYILGAVDPETSHYPCTDALASLTVFHFDAQLTLELRMRRLVNLLPFVDPQLHALLQARALSPQVFMIIARCRKYMLDFDWIDQSIVHRDEGPRYGLPIGLPLWIDGLYGSEFRLRETGIAMMSERFRAQLALEMPALADRVSVAEWIESRDDRPPVFMVAFSDIAPVLDQLFDLHALRRNVTVYKPREAAARMQRILSLQLRQARDSATVSDIVQATAAWDWRGYREKDAALDLLLTAANTLQKMTRGEIGEMTRETFADAIMAIGYPSESLHRAQADKHTLRRWGDLLAAAREPNHPRFHEAWLFLSQSTHPLDASRLRDLRALFQRLSALGTRLPAFALAKMLDTLARLGDDPQRSAGTVPLLRTLMESLAPVVQRHADPRLRSKYRDILAVLERRGVDGLRAQAPDWAVPRDEAPEPAVEAGGTSGESAEPPAA